MFKDVVWGGLDVVCGGLVVAWGGLGLTWQVNVSSSIIDSITKTYSGC